MRVCVYTCLPLLALLAGCSVGLDAMPEVDESLMDGELVYFEDHGDYLVFLPRQVFQRVGIVFYPGALVEAEAYTPWLHVLAQRGYPVAIARFPLRLAVLSPNRARAIIAGLEDEGDVWIIE
ncbi:MAG: alpha/beta hydrolase [Candidatus Hydrogenedentota bacterium]